MTGLVLGVVLVALTAWVMYAVVRADMKDEAADRRWHEDPRRAWNGGHVPVGEDAVNHPYRVQCACGEWCYDFDAHITRVAAA